MDADPEAQPVDVSIVIVSYNTRDLTLACLESLERHPSRASAEIIVLDNASSDGSADAIGRQFPRVRLMRLGENLGFAAGNNVAAREAIGDYLLLLNPDTEIRDGTIDAALAFARQRGPCLVGGRTLFADGRLNRNSCHGWPTLWGVTCQMLGLSSLARQSRLLNPEGLGRWSRDSSRRVPAITGCFLLLPRAVWHRLDGFDEAFFMYGEETDLCMRAAKLGMDRWICKDATLVHHGGASEPVRVEKMIRLFAAKARLYRKHWPRLLAWYGICGLKLWALSRAVGHGLLSRLQPPSAGDVPASDVHQPHRIWRTIWQRRGEFTAVQVARVSRACHIDVRAREGVSSLKPI